MNILYLSCHETLEYYDVQNLRDLGFNVFTVGHNTYNNNDLTFRKLGPNDPELQSLFDYEYNRGQIKLTYGFGNPAKLCNSFVSKFDIILNPHWIENVQMNWAYFKSKIFIYRSIASFSTNHERFFEKYRRGGVKVIRLSPAEKFVSNYMGSDAVIRTSLDPNYPKLWTGEDLQILTVHKMMDVCNSRMKPEYEQITNMFADKRILCGKKNDTIKYARSEVSEDEVNDLRQKSRVYLALCSKRAPLVYSFSEALMAGMPVVTFSKSLIGYEWFEQPDFIENGVSGFYGDTIEEMQQQIQTLLDDYDLAKSMSVKARETAIKNFSTDIIKGQWKSFFKEYYNIDTL